MSPLERAQPVLITGGLVAGTAGSLLAPVRAAGRVALLPLLVALLATVFVQVEPRAATRVLRDRRVLVTSLLANFVLAPAAAFGLGRLLLADSPDLALGLVMLLVTPCTDWYLAFTATARGDLAVATGLLPVNLFLQLLLLPAYVVLLGGPFVPVDGGAVLGSVGLVAGLPLLAAVVLRLATSPGWRERVLQPRLATMGVLLLTGAVTAMFAWEGAQILERPGVVVTLLGPLAIFFLGSFAFAQAASRLLGLPHAQRVTLTMTVLARNSPLALAVAATAFADRPAIALALVAAPVIELPVLALASATLRRLEPAGSA